MKKEFLLRVVIDGDRIGTVLQKNGFDESLSSSFEVIGILQKVVNDEQSKIDKKLDVRTNYTVKEPMDRRRDSDSDLYL